MKKIFVIIFSLVMLLSCSMVVCASDDSNVDSNDFLYLSDVSESDVVSFADSFARTMGHSDYSCTSVIKYVRDNEWVGYYVIYSGNNGFGFAVIDFSVKSGNFVTEFAFDLEDIPFSDDSSTIALSSEDSCFVESSGDIPFSYSVNPILARDAIMGGTLVIPKDRIFLFSTPGESESHFISTYDPAKSLVSRDAMIALSGGRYACPVASGIALLRQEGMTGGHSESYMFEWLWRKCKIYPEWEYTLDNYDSWPAWCKSYRKVLRYDGNDPVYCIASGCNAKRFVIAFYGQSESEMRNSWLFSKAGCNSQLSGIWTRSKWGIDDTAFIDAVNRGFPSIFMFSQKCTAIDENGNEYVTDMSHAVNVVGYAVCDYHYSSDGVSVVPGRTVYAIVADGWNDDAPRYMDVTNMKFFEGSEYDVVLYSFSLVR